MEGLIDKKGAGALLGVSPRTIDRLRAAGTLRAVKIRRSVRFQVAELERLLQKSRERA